MIALAIAAVLVTRLLDPVVRGTVRTADTEEPIAAVLIEVADAAVSARSDSIGVYVLRQISPGRHTLRFSRLGYQSLTLDVLVPDDAPLRLDVSLSPRPSELTPVLVLSGARAPSGGDGHGSPPGSAPGAWHVPALAARGTPHLGDADALRALAGSPEVPMLPEQPTTVHVRGGSADHNLVLLDGVPVYNAVHAGEIFGAVNPDVIGDVTLHGSVPSAQFGGRLSGVIDMRTRDSAGAGVSMRGGIGTTAVRATVDLPLPHVTGAVTLSGRHSYRGLSERLIDPAGGAEGWGDVFAKSSLTLGDHELHLFSLASADRLSFGGSEEEDGGRELDHQGMTEDRTPGAILTAHRLRWSTTAHGVIWRHRPSGHAQVEARAWESEARATADWPAARGALRLRSAVRHLGFSSSVSWLHAGGDVTAGVALEGLRAGYDVADTEGPARASSGAPLLHRASAPIIASAFAQEWRALSDRWTLGAGVRAARPNGAGPQLEPRLTIIFAPSARVALSAGYAREHQYLQSLRNEESIVDALVGIDVPIAVGATGVPVARSDELAARVRASFGRATTVTLDAYARTLHGLILVAASTREPFATDSVRTGGGQVRGLTLELVHETERLSVRGTYAVETVTRRSGDLRYIPSFAPAHVASLAADYRLGARTRLRSALWAASGRPRTSVEGEVGWEWDDPLFRERDVTGSLRGVSGPLNGERLPAYLRLDAGIRHDFDVPRSRAKLSAFLNVDNIARRRNVLAYRTVQSAGPRRPLLMLPLSLTFGLDWRY